MNELLVAAQPVANNWFNPNIEYDGTAEAEFVDPPGVIKGRTLATYNEHGEQEIVMGVNAKHLRDGTIFDFLKVGGLTNNPCKQLIIRTRQGMFYSTGNVIYSYSFSLGNDTSGFRITFHVMEALFEKSGAQLPRYWVLPLSNFLSDFTDQYKELGRHALRLYPTPKVPRKTSRADRKVATYIANQKNRLIVFETEQGLGFIEPLIDYKDRENNLRSGRERNALTAIMVGELGNHPCNNYTDLQTWFPIDFIHLLGLATGSEVGAPWIELRDAKGKLVKRIHVNLGNPTFIKGHRSIDEEAAKGIGRLLTQAVVSSYWRTSVLRVVLRHTIRGGFYEQTLLEDRFGYLCRGLETLCKHFGLSKQQLTDGFNDKQKIIIKGIVDKANKALMRFSQEPEIAIDIDKVRKIEKISDRIKDSTSKSKDFGLAVCDLLTRFSLPDANIIDAHYKAHPRPDKRKSWHQVLSYYRGAVFHEGYFDIQGNQYNRQDILVIISHLHDILVRILLQMLNYSASYIPTVGSYVVNMPIDWVNPNTPIEKLGYE